MLSIEIFSGITQTSDSTVEVILTSLLSNFSKNISVLPSLMMSQSIATKFSSRFQILRNQVDLLQPEGMATRPFLTSTSIQS